MCQGVLFAEYAISIIINGGYLLMEKMDIFALVDELQEVIEMSPTKGFSKNKLVDQKIVMEIIEDIKTALHEELDFAKKVASERDQILRSADIQAEEIVRRAKKEAEAMVKQEEVTKMAYEKANKVMENSRTRAEEIKKMANTYAEEVLDELEKYYRESMDLIGENKARLYAKAKTEEQKQADN